MNVLQAGQSNVNFLVFKGQMFIAFIRHLILQDETTVCSWSTGQQTLSGGYLNKGRPTWWHLLYYVNLLLSMFRMLIHPSSGACNYLVHYCVGCIVLTWGMLVLCNGIGCWWCIRVQAEPLLVQPALGYHITNSHSHYITPTRLKSAYTTTQQVVASSWRWMY